MIEFLLGYMLHGVLNPDDTYPSSNYGKHLTPIEIKRQKIKAIGIGKKKRPLPIKARIKH